MTLRHNVKADPNVEQVLREVGHRVEVEDSLDVEVGHRVEESAR